MDWSSVIGNVASGGLLGLLGTALGEGIGYFRRKQEFEQKLALSRDERETLKLRGELTQAEVAGMLARAREEGATAAFVASQQAEQSLKGEHRWVTSFRAFTRPGLTWFGVGTSAVFVLFPPTSVIGQELASTLNVYSGMMIAWWFGQRAVDRLIISWGNSVANGYLGSRPPVGPTPGKSG